MAPHIYSGWCNIRAQQVRPGRQLHLVTEIAGARAKVHPRIVQTVLSHYEDPDLLAQRVRRVGLKKASMILRNILPQTQKARSGHVGEILANETVAAVVSDFIVPIRRLRWLDGRETALRGEDVIGIAQTAKRTRFLKGESKSRISLGAAVVAQARETLRANKGRPSQHAMTFVMRQLFDQGNDKLALAFERYLVDETIADADLVHLFFGLSGNDASAALAADLKAYTGKIEQHAVNLRIPDHAAFIASLYKD